MFRRANWYPAAVFILILTVTWKLWTSYWLVAESSNVAPILASELTQYKSKSAVESWHAQLDSPSVSGYQDVLRHQVTRKRMLTDTCEALFQQQMSLNNTEQDLDQRGQSLLTRAGQFLHVLDKYKTIFCLVPKVCSTNMMRMFINISTNGTDEQDITGNLHSENYMAKYGVRPLRNYTEAERNVRLKSYYKVLLVRHPLIRWLSAYLEKFSPDNQWYPKNVGRFMIEEFRKHASKESLARGHDVRFSEFVTLLLRNVRLNDYGDPHWAPYAELCAPCHIEYDFIMKVETLYRDMAYLRERRFQNNTFAYLPPPYSNATNADMARMHYAKIRRKDMRRLLSVYSNEFKMFSYNSSLNSL